MKVSQLIGELISYINRNGDHSIYLNCLQFDDEGRRILDVRVMVDGIICDKGCILTGFVEE
uniref:Uncharacterized protein n=1 Tax=viral metagenome TaxID=1070528 RepID=A0A6M3JHQ1_9ZZZZ